MTACFHRRHGVRKGFEGVVFHALAAHAAPRLRAAGISTIAQLYAASRDRLRAVWGGVEGARFYEWMRGAPLERRVRRLPARTPIRSFRKRLVLWEVVCDFVPGCLGTDEDMTRRPHSRIILKCPHR